MGKHQELKKYMKRLMPFVQVIREKIQLVGLNAFNLTLDFDEFKVLQDNKKYLENTLDVSVLDVNFIDISISILLKLVLSDNLLFIFMYS